MRQRAQLLPLKSSFHTDLLEKHIFIAMYTVSFSMSLIALYHKLLGILWIIIQLLSLRSLLSEEISFHFYIRYLIYEKGRKNLMIALAAWKEDFLIFFSRSIQLFYIWVDRSENRRSLFSSDRYLVNF